MLAMLRNGYLMTRVAWRAELGHLAYVECDDGQIWMVHGDPADMSRAAKRQLWRPWGQDLTATDWKVAESER